jgi:hypothetical protein
MGRNNNFVEGFNNCGWNCEKREKLCVKVTKRDLRVIEEQRNAYVSGSWHCEP